jgi:hypothetical protein
MSSLKTIKPGPAKKKAAPGTRVARGAEKFASDAGMTAQDKANFIKAMAEGLKPKGAKAPKAKAPGAEEPKKVEILRKIPGAQSAPRPGTPESVEALKLADALEQRIAAGEIGALTPEAMQALMAALCKLYAAHVDAGDRFPVVAGRMAISGTEAMILCGALLKAVDLQVFELGMWQSWSGL